MCGIFGSSYKGDPKRGRRGMNVYPRHPAHRTRVEGMLQVMKHRGPDTQYVASTRRFSLGLARLSVFEGASPFSAQPLISEKETITAFNGEIYNYRSLSSVANSEVALLSRMLDDGYDIRQYIDGDYAVAHFDPNTNLLSLYRDRFGVCPLYYQLHPWVEVSSERRRLQNPREVPAHGFVEIDVYAKKVTCWNWLPLYGVTCDEATKPSLHALAEALEKACATRAWHSDAEFSLALSGGLDSSLVLLALAVGKALLPKECIATGFTEKSEDLYFAERLADSLGCPFKKIIIDRSDDEAVIEHLDLPRERITDLMFQGALRSWHVAKHAPTKVILCGDGADELLGGYACHRPERFQGRKYAMARKRLSTIRSMQHFNLDRTNKMGMAHSKEFRAPLLASSFSQMLLSLPYEEGKDVFRRLVSYYGGHFGFIANRESKYSADELRITQPKEARHEPQLTTSSGGEGHAMQPRRSTGYEPDCFDCPDREGCSAAKRCVMMPR